jgi:hypothetical protein
MESKSRINSDKLKAIHYMENITHEGSTSIEWLRENGLLLKVNDVVCDAENCGSEVREFNDSRCIDGRRFYCINNQ